MNGEGGAPAFVTLPDGRLDLLPVSVDNPVASGFTWGYPGGGPRALSAALTQLLSIRDGTARPDLQDIVVQIKGSELRLTISDLRARPAGTDKRRTRDP